MKGVLFVGGLCDRSSGIACLVFRLPMEVRAGARPIVHCVDRSSVYVESYNQYQRPKSYIYDKVFGPTEGQVRVADCAILVHLNLHTPFDWLSGGFFPHWHCAVDIQSSEWLQLHYICLWANWDRKNAHHAG